MHIGLPKSKGTMHLKRLEIYGYKSFASRCTFEFSEGVTAIVGPNGSGKSNVADAVRWVLGEQSYRLLRANTTEDMIFAGAPGRPRLGMAEVILTFDNADGWLPIDYTEVTVGRRAYRSGENEYLLNGQRVRYRDVVDLLGAAGLARSSYLVIGQGMVDAALALRPEARRTLFEEAAGIGAHLRKREEALANIAETERNLERVQDILNELRPRAETLRRQAERAEEYLLLRQDLRELQRIWYGYTWQRLQRDLAAAEEQVREHRGRLEAQRDYVQACQEEIRQAEAREAECAARIERWMAQWSNLRSEMEGLRREAAVAAERQRLYRTQWSNLQEELQTLASRRAILEEEATRAEGELEEHLAAAKDLSRALEEARQVLQGEEAAREEEARALDEMERRLRGLERTITQEEMRREEVTERIRRLAGDIETLDGKAKALAGRFESLQKQGDRLRERAEALEAAQRTARDALAALEQDLLAVRGRLAESEKALREAQAERDRLALQREALLRLRQEGAAYSPGVRKVLAPESGLKGILGTVSSLMTVPREYEGAIEAALGSRLQQVIVEHWEDAEAAIALLKRTRAGWATFLPLDTLRPPAPLAEVAWPGVVGVASHLVRFEERLRPAFDLLLGRVLVVTDLAVARRLLGERTGASLIVTLDGETVQPSGAVSGGARAEKGHLLAQEREWRELPERLRSAEAAVQEAARCVEALQAQQQALQSQCADQEQAISAKRREWEATQEALAAHRRELRDAERERDWLKSRREAAVQERQDLQAQKGTLEKRLAEAIKERASLAERVEAARARLEAMANNPSRQAVATLETRLTVTQRTLESQRRLAASYRESLRQLEEQIAAKNVQAQAVEEALRRLEAEIEARAAQMKALTEEGEAIQRQLAPAREAQALCEKARREAEGRYAQSLERFHEVESELAQATLHRDRLQDQREALAREIEAELGPIDLPEAQSHQLRLNLGDDIVELPQVPTLPPGLTEEIRQLKARLRRLGDVNPEAPHEYQQLLERQTFLQGQIADLKGAIAALHEVIQELDTIIERDFVQTVRVVDEAFRAYFTRLFGGGTARLELTAPESPSTSGVEIIAHPPGKRAQNLSLLSGGERALTAVALIFALLRANPVPFCFLDEVDAALDEANVGRFRDLLIEHARTTQFVVITHNRHTIDAANTIYGISMGEQGVSQMVSLRLADAREASWVGEERASAGS